jgi:hypothetical protein
VPIFMKKITTSLSAYGLNPGSFSIWSGGPTVSHGGRAPPGSDGASPYASNSSSSSFSFSICSGASFFLLTFYFGDFRRGKPEIHCADDPVYLL